MALRDLRNRVLIATSSALLVLSFSGCEDDKPADASSSVEGDDTTFAPEPDPDAESEGETETAGGDAVEPADFVNRLQSGLSSATTAHVTLNTAVEGGGFTAEGDVDLGSTPPAMFMEMKNPALGGDITFILIKKISYVQLPQFGGKFLQFKFDDPNSPLGGDLIDSFDPRASVADLEGSLQSVTYVGDEVVDGESRAHYEVVIDASAFEGADSDAGTHDLGVWLDGEDRISQFVFDLGAEGSVTASYTDWGKDVIIEAPAPDDIISLPGQ